VEGEGCEGVVLLVVAFAMAIAFYRSDEARDGIAASR